MSVRATAAVIRDVGAEFALEEVEIDDPRADEVLVRVVAAGMCHTDLMARDLGMTSPPWCSDTKTPAWWNESDRQ
jgi:aryl-alcohol dehydrogenase